MVLKAADAEIPFQICANGQLCSIKAAIKGHARSWVVYMLRPILFAGWVKVCVRLLHCYTLSVAGKKRHVSDMFVSTAFTGLAVRRFCTFGLKGEVNPRSNIKIDKC